MLAKTSGSAVYGVNAHLITVEVDVGQGLDFFWWVFLTAP